MGERDRGRERIPSRLHTQHGARCGARSHDPGITTRAEIESQTLNPLSHPGAPLGQTFEWFFPRGVERSTQRPALRARGAQKETSGLGARELQAGSQGRGQRAASSRIIHDASTTLGFRVLAVPETARRACLPGTKRDGPWDKVPPLSARAQPASPRVTPGPLLPAAGPWEGTVTSWNANRGVGHPVAVWRASRAQVSRGLRPAGPCVRKDGSSAHRCQSPARPRGTVLGSQALCPRPWPQTFPPWGAEWLRGGKLHPDFSLFLQKS